jgi:tetratricopeptide (TPR) repeat protein
MEKSQSTSTLCCSLSQSNRERPRKKARLSTCVDTISRLTQMGLAAWAQQLHSEAEKCFSQAFSRGGYVGFLCAHIQESSTTHKATERPEKALERDVILSGKNDTGNPPSLTTVAYPKPESLTHSKTFRCKRHEYNEGMHVYDEPLPIGKSDHPDLIPSTLLYNVGQTYVYRGHYDIAITWFQKSLARNDVDHPLSALLVLKLLHNLGFCLYRLHQRDQSMQHYEHALWHISQFGMEEIHRAASLNCIGILHCSRLEMEKAITILKQSLSIYQSHSGKHSSTVATVLNNIGSTHYLSADYEKCLSVSKEALNIQRELLGGESIEVAAILFNAGLANRRLGHLRESVLCFKDFIDIVLKHVGSESVMDVTIAYMQIADIYCEQGELDMAVSNFKKALCSGRSSVGAFHPEVASILNRLGNLSCETRDFDGAMTYYQEGLEIEKVTLNYPHMIITLTNIANIHKLRDNFADALCIFKKAKTVQMDHYGPNSIDLAETCSSIGLIQYRMKAFGEAFDSYQQALSIRRDFYEDDFHLDIASTLNSIGLVAFKLEIFDLAKCCVGGSMRILQKLARSDSRDIAVMWYNLATIYFQSGEGEDVAIRCYKESLRIERDNLGPDHPEVVLSLLHIGQEQQKSGVVEEALSCFLEALEIERGRVVKKELSIANILNLIGNIHLQQGNIGKMMSSYVEASRIFDAHQHPRETLVIAGYNFYGLSKTHPGCAPTA